MRRLTGDEHLSPEFAATWPAYDLDAGTRALLGYAQKLTDMPAAVEDADVAALRAAGWDDRAVYEATALVAFFNFTGRMEAASGLPQDQIAADARIREAVPVGAGTRGRARAS